MSNFLRICAVLVMAFSLAACGSFHRDRTAAAAKVQMIGMSREDVLECMGPAKRTSAEGATEVWSYHSSDGRYTSTRDSVKITGWYKAGPATGSRSFCTVNVVMKNGIVTAVHYLGPSASSVLNDYDQCGYAVAACVGEQL